MVPAEDDREDALADDPRHGSIDLVKALLDVRRDHEHVTEIDEVELLLEVDGHVDRVGVVERRDATDRLWSETTTRPIGGAHVERRAEHRDLVLADLVHILQVGRLAEGVDACERRLLPPRERRDRAVLDGRRRLESELESTLDRLALLTVCDVRELAQVAHPPELPMVRFSVSSHLRLLRDPPVITS
jgi:hypothetical protein